MAIPSIDVEMDDAVPYPNQEPVRPEQDKVGETALIIFALITALATVSFIAKKRRVTSTQAQPNTPAPMEIVVDENVPQEPAPRCDLKDQRKVEKIVKTVAEGGAPLYVFGFRLWKLGDEIDGIHPFSFLLAASKEPFKEHFRTIFHSNNDFKIGTVMRGIKKGMERKYGNLHQYVDDLAAAFKKDPKPIRPMIRAHSWRQLVHYLFEVSAPRGE